MIFRMAGRVLTEIKLGDLDVNRWMLDQGYAVPFTPKAMFAYFPSPLFEAVSLLRLARRSPVRSVGLVRMVQSGDGGARKALGQLVERSRCEFEPMVVTPQQPRPHPANRNMCTSRSCTSTQYSGANAGWHGC